MQIEAAGMSRRTISAYPPCRPPSFAIPTSIAPRSSPGRAHPHSILTPILIIAPATWACTLDAWLYYCVAAHAAAGIVLMLYLGVAEE